MGHLEEKYNTDYFLGSNDATTGQPYGVLGHQEFKTGKIHERNLQEFEFTRSLIGSLAGKDVLEIGFGRGDFIPLFLKEDISTYTGIDFSETAVMIANKHFRDPRLQLFHMEAKDLPENKKYDLIVMYDVVEHIPVFEMEIVWEKINLLLNPKGYLVIATPIFDNPNMSDHTEKIPSVSGIHCNKQTIGTLMLSCLKYNFIIAGNEGRIFGMIRNKDYADFNSELRNNYMATHSMLLRRFDIFDSNVTFNQDIESKLVQGAGRVAIGCVAENHPKFLTQALRLLQSLRWLGGSMAGANFFVCTVGDIDTDYAHIFKRLGAFVRVVSRFNDQHEHSNKLRFLELTELKFYDTVILLDCDTIIVQDPWPYLNGAAFQAKIADLPTINRDMFERVFRYFNIESQEENYRCNPGNIPTIWYCNAGVLIFPQRILQSLGSYWLTFNKALLENLYLLGSKKYFCDQVSLSLAFAKQPVSYRELPLSMNYPLHLTHRKDLSSFMDCDPVIIHYHGRIDENGYLLSSPYPKVHNRIEQFNKLVREDRRHNFNNKTFWDFRYFYSPDKGSGQGSRGTQLAYKKELLRKLTDEYKPQSIFDIGCGDQAVADILPDEIYTGIDISDIIIEQNKVTCPSRKFIAGDILKLEMPKADMVICLDMLIHIKDRADYCAIIKRLIELTGKCCLISGYEDPPDIKHDITFYHEPLSKTLSDAGVNYICKVGSYRNVIVWILGPGVSNDKKLGRFEDIDKNIIREPVFVVGCMRSGTTLISEIIGEFDGIIHCPFELKNVWSWVGGVPMASPKTRDDICPQLGANDVKKGQKERLVEAFLNEMAKNIRGGIDNNKIFLNKNPHLCNKLPFVNTLFPDSRFIWIYRDMPKVVASMKSLFDDVNRRQQTWHYWPDSKSGTTRRCWDAFHFVPPPEHLDISRCFPGGNLRYLCEYWLETNQAVSEFFQSLPANRGLIIKEEHLIDNPEIQIARCQGFLGLPLSIPKDIRNGIDNKRNSVWGSRLGHEELRIMLDFVETNSEIIDRVFPEEKCSDMYINMIKAYLS